MMTGMVILTELIPVAVARLLKSVLIIKISTRIICLQSWILFPPKKLWPLPVPQRPATRVSHVLAGLAYQITEFAELPVVNHLLHLSRPLIYVARARRLRFLAQALGLGNVLSLRLVPAQTVPQA